jgi:mannose-6-phosphate isomerase-like protein (cupin superfamily)
MLNRVVAMFMLGSACFAAHSQALTPEPTVPLDRASYFSNINLQDVWKDLETRQVMNKRVIEGGKFSVNIRIVRPTDPPLVHAKSVDLWVVTQGTATAVTGGTLVDQRQGGQADDLAGSSIKDGVNQPLTVGDMIFVPPGVPHGFKNLKNFRAVLVRWDVK